MIAGRAEDFETEDTVMVGEAPEFTVVKGHRYRATVSLSFVEAQFGRNDQIAERLTAAGFADVEVTGDGRTRTAEATWPKDDATGPIDSHISAITDITVAASG